MTQFAPHSRQLLRLLAVVVTAGTAAAAYGLTTAAWARHVAPGGQSGVNRTLSALPEGHLTVMIHDGYLTAQGPAGEVRQAAELFASIGDIAVFSGDREQGRARWPWLWPRPTAKITSNSRPLMRGSPRWRTTTATPSASITPAAS